MIFLKSAAVAAVVALAALPAAASSLTDQFTSFWVLGDSLSNTGNAGRATNGQLWNEPILQEFSDAGLAGGNLAYSGANVVPMGEAGILDLPQQVAALAAFQSSFGDTPLVSVWIGGNDAAPISLGGYSVALVQSIYRQSIESLVALGVRDFLTFELPDAGDTPLVQLLDFFGSLDAGAVTQAALDLNSAFAEVHAQIAASVPGVTFYNIELFELSRELRDNPALFGATYAGPCLDPLFRTPIAGVDCADTAYWDGFHPTENVHLYLTDLVRAELQPVPLPASALLLVGGLAGLALTRRRAA